MRTLFALAVFAVIPTVAANAADYVTVKGRIVWDEAKNGAVPDRKAIKPTKDEEVCAKDKAFFSEEWVVNPKTKGIQNVVVWLLPEPDAAVLAALKAGTTKEFPTYDAKDIHPGQAKLAKAAVEIDQPCCRFIPHVVVAREGQDMVIKNSA